MHTAIWNFEIYTWKPCCIFQEFPFKDHISFPAYFTYKVHMYSHLFISKLKIVVVTYMSHLQSIIGWTPYSQFLLILDAQGCMWPPLLRLDVAIDRFAFYDNKYNTVLQPVQIYIQQRSYHWKIKVVAYTYRYFSMHLIFIKPAVHSYTEWILRINSICKCSRPLPLVSIYDPYWL